MLEVLKRTWQWFIALAVIGGLYLGADAVGRVALFFELGGVAVVLGGATVAGLKAKEPIKRARERLRQYPALEAENNALRSELAEARRQATEDNEQAVKDKRAALLRGRLEAGGVIMAHMNPIPVLKGVVKQDNQLLLMAEISPAAKNPNHSIYSVRSTMTGEVKGIVSVRGPGNRPNTILLECQDQWVLSFWEKLGSTADISTALPDDLELALCSIPEIDARGPVVMPRPNIRGVA